MFDHRGLPLALAGAGLIFGLTGCGADTAPVDASAPAQPADDHRTSSDWWRQSGAQMERRLARLLPDNTRIESTSAPASSRRASVLHAVVSNNMAGSGAMKVRVAPIGTDRELTCPAAVEPPDTCVMEEGAQPGTQVRHLQRVVGDLVILSVEVVHDDGGLVQVSAANTLEDTWDPSNRTWGPEPAASAADLAAIAASPVWQQG